MQTSEIRMILMLAALSVPVATAPAMAQLPATGQTTSFGTDSDGNVQAGAARSFTDNGDGTITDNVTGLMWEKKSDDGSVHDKDNTYTWGMATSPYTMNGTMVSTFLSTLNSGGGFAGYTDWRIPNIYELQSILNYDYANPAVDPEFDSSCSGACTVTTCSCTGTGAYGSSTTNLNTPQAAWYIYYVSPSQSLSAKSGNFNVRAVR